jgi:hypothetical protein
VPDLPTSVGTIFDFYPDGRGGYRKWEGQPLPSTPPNGADALPPAAGQLAVLVPTAEVLAVGHNTQLIVAQGGDTHTS